MEVGDRLLKKTSRSLWPISGLAHFHCKRGSEPTPQVGPVRLGHRENVRVNHTRRLRCKVVNVDLEPAEGTIDQPV